MNKKKTAKHIVGERWVDIIGYEGLYRISTLGRVSSYPKVQNGNKMIIRKITIDNRGYYRVCVGHNRKKETFKVHRVVAAHFIPNPNNLKEINHIDGNKLNNSVDNLEWSNRSLNIRHAFNTGLIQPQRGSKNGFSILNEKQVTEIFQSNDTLKKLAIKYRVSKYCIYDIKRGRSWNHVTGL